MYTRRAARGIDKDGLPPETPTKQKPSTSEGDSVKSDEDSTDSIAKAVGRIKLQSSVMDMVHKGGVTSFSGSEPDFRDKFSRLANLLMQVFMLVSSAHVALLGDFLIGEAEFDSGANVLLYGILFALTTKAAHTIVLRFQKNSDGRRAWLMLKNEYCTSPSLSDMTNLEQKIQAFSFDNTEPSEAISKLLHFNDQLAEMETRHEETIVRSLYAAMKRSPSYKTLVLLIDQLDVIPTRDMLSTRMKDYYRGFLCDPSSLTLPTVLATKNQEPPQDFDQAGRGGRGRGRRGGRGGDRGGSRPAPPCSICRDGSIHWFSECPCINQTSLNATRAAAPPRQSDGAALLVAQQDNSGQHDVLGIALVSTSNNAASGWPLMLKILCVLVIFAVLVLGVVYTASTLWHLLLPVFSGAVQTLGITAVATGGGIPFVGTSQFVIDSGATSHVFKDNVFAPSTFVGSGGVFQTHSKYASFNSAGYGSAVVPMVVSSGGTSDVDFHNAYYTPDGNFNLISSLVLVKKFGWQNPDFVKDVWVTNTGVPLRISYHKGLPVLTAKIVSVAVEPNDALVAVGGGHGSRDRDTSDWQFRISLSQHLARTYASSGEWTHDLFTDGNGVTNGNSMAHLLATPYTILRRIISGPVVPTGRTLRTLQVVFQNSL